MHNFPVATPESVGISSDSLLRIMKKLAELEYLNSIIILRHGKSALECWLSPYERETPHQLFSLSKSFTSCAIGIVQAEGRLNISDKLVSFFPEYTDCITDKRMFDVTLEDLLTMRSGHLVCSTKYMFGEQDWVKAFLASPLDTAPGSAFTYNSGATYMLSAVIRKVTNENVREYLLPRLFEPLQIAPGIWESCPRGINFGGWGLYLTTDDIAKFSQLLLQHGRWNGRQLIPAGYLAEATVKHADNSMNIPPDWKLGYGYQFWISQHGYRGDGASGQYAVVIEEKDLCIAVTSCLGDMQRVLTVFWEELIPHLKDEVLAENPTSFEELQQYLANLQILPRQSAVEGDPVNKTFCFKDNSAGITQCDVAFGEKNCTLTFTTSRGTEQLWAGFGHFEYSIFQLTDTLPHPVAASTCWVNEHTLEIHSLICDGIFRDIWSIDFSDTAEPLKNQILCSCFRPGKPRLFCRTDSKAD